MNKTLLLLMISLVSFSLQAQNCTPDLIYADSLPGTYPLPEPFGVGIENPACVNLYYEHVLHVQVPETFEVGGTSISLDYFKFEPNGAIVNLPVGMDYVCNPPTCEFLANTVGCVILYGTPTDVNALTDYDIKVGGELSGLNGAITTSDTIPGGQLIEGNYYLTLLEEGNANCVPVFTEDLSENIYHIELVPNPVNEVARLNVTLKEASRYQYQIMDLTGKILNSASLELFEGDQTVELNLIDLQEGMYIFRLFNESADLTTKLVKSK